MSEFQLVVRDLSKNYGKIEALKNGNFSIKKGIITSFLGENGAGKTTTIKCILGFLKRNSGEVKMNAERVGYVPEHPVIFSWLKGKEILYLTAKLYGISEEKLIRLVETYGEKIGFDTQLLLRKVHTYSLGNQKKFSFLQSLIVSPDFLIVDEPFYSLDPVSIKKIRELFLELKDEGVSLFLSSHIISEIEKITDEIIIIKKGNIVIQKNLKNFKDDFIFIQLDKNGIKENQLQHFTSFIRERDSYFEILLERSFLESFEKFLEKKEKLADKNPLDLEKIFLFFTK